MHIDRSPPSGHDLSQRLAAKIARTGRREDAATIPANPRAERSRRTCWLPADHPELAPPPRDSGAYVPEMAAAIDNDRNLTDGARRCARKLAEYVYRSNRDSRTAPITVTYLMRALRKSRRSVQRYLRELERAGYIAVSVIHARTRMCAGLMIELLATLIPRHGWKKSMKTDAPKLSHNNRLRYKNQLIPRVLWAVKCTDPIQKAWDRLMTPLTPIF